MTVSSGSTEFYVSPTHAGHAGHADRPTRCIEQPRRLVFGAISISPGTCFMLAGAIIVGAVFITLGSALPGIACWAGVAVFAQISRSSRAFQQRCEEIAREIQQAGVTAQPQASSPIVVGNSDHGYTSDLPVVGAQCTSERRELFRSLDSLRQEGRLERDLLGCGRTLTDHARRRNTRLAIADRLHTGGDRRPAARQPARARRRAIREAAR